MLIRRSRLVWWWLHVFFLWFFNLFFLFFLCFNNLFNFFYFFSPLAPHVSAEPAATTVATRPVTAGHGLEHVGGSIVQ